MQKNARLFLIIGALMGMLGVILGAFGAHGIRDAVTERLYQGWLTGARYQMFHAFFLLAIGLLMNWLEKHKLLVVAGWLSVAGVILFSGSLYAMAAFEPLKLGLVTPLGGVLLIAAWVLLIIQLFRTATK